MKILAIHNNAGSRFYRLNPQLNALIELGHRVELVAHSDPGLQQKIAWCDVVIFQMVLSPEYSAFARKLGKKVVFECDDLIHTVPKTHYSRKELSGLGRWKTLWQVYRTFRKTDLLIFSNRKLKLWYGLMGRRSVVFENYIDLPHWLKERKQSTSDEIRILWAGSTSHTGDLLMIRPVMKRILEEYPNVRFFYVGHGGGTSKQAYSRYIYGDDLFDGLPENHESMLAVPPNVWPYKLASTLADIAIAPLERNHFNSFKTQCKFYEYAINGIPCVASRWFYKDIKDGETGLLVASEDEWYECLKLLIENLGLRVKIGEAAYRWVLETRDMRKHVGRWTSEIERLNESKKHHTSGASKDRTSRRDRQQ